MGTVSSQEHSHTNDPSLRRLYLIGFLTAGVYLVTSMFYVRGAQAHSRTARELFAWFLALCLLPLFWQGYKALKQSSSSNDLLPIIGFGALFCLLAFLTVPFHSTDVFGYINRGWQQIHYRQNPYVYTISSIPNWQQDPMLWDHWIHNPNPYGFLFTLLARLIAWVGNGNWWLTLALFKTVNVLAFGLTAWLVWSGAKLSGFKRPDLALYLVLWNPLILVHHVANGHNDILIGCALALTFYLAMKRAFVWIIPVLVAATLLKYGPVLIIPLAVIYIFRNKGWRVVALGCLLSLVIAIPISAPYLKDWEMLRLVDIQQNATLIDNSLHSFLYHVYGTVAGVIPALAPFRETVSTVIKISVRGALVLFLILAVVRMMRNASASSFMYQSVLVMFVLLCVATSKFNAWYLGMLLPPALFLSEDSWLRRLVILITCAELLSITFFKQAYMLNYFAMIIIPSLIVFWQERGRRVAERELLVTPPARAPQLVRISDG